MSPARHGGSSILPKALLVFELALVSSFRRGLGVSSYNSLRADGPRVPSQQEIEETVWGLLCFLCSASGTVGTSSGMRSHLFQSPSC